MKAEQLSRREFAVALLGTVGTLAGCDETPPANSPGEMPSMRGDPGERIPYAGGPEQFGEMPLPKAMVLIPFWS